MAKLQLSPTEQLDFYDDSLPGHMRNKKIEYMQLSSDQFHLISDWWHYGILNLLQTQGFKTQLNWIAKRLGLSLKIVQEAWERLLRLGHLEKSGNKFIRKYPRISSTDDLFDLSIQKSHLEDLKLIEKSLLDVPVTERDHTSITLVLNRKDIVKAKELIRIFQDQFTDQIESHPGEEVYRLSMSLFPLTRKTEDK